MTTATTSWSDLAELRQGVYRFFAGAMLPPDPARHEQLLSAAVALDELGIDDVGLATAWRDVVDVLHDSAFDELEREYGALFVTSSGAGICPPIESLYGAAPGRTPIVEGRLRSEYARLGIGMHPSSPVSTDHLCVQLEVMSSLCHDEAHAWSDERDGDARAALRNEWTFLDRHLARWVPRWSEHVRQTAGDGRWSQVASATAELVGHDLGLVSALTRARPSSS